MRLLADADVLIENLKTGTMERWGLGYEAALKAQFPGLIHCRISGYGADGPLGGYPGYDAIIQAMLSGSDSTGWQESNRVYKSVMDSRFNFESGFGKSV